MHTCQNCGNPVTVDFARVFGNSRDELKRCPACADMTEIKSGRGARDEVSSGVVGWAPR